MNNKLLLLKFKNCVNDIRWERKRQRLIWKYLEESFEVGLAAMLGDMEVWGHPVGDRGPPGRCCGALTRSLCVWAGGFLGKVDC